MIMKFKVEVNNIPNETEKLMKDIEAVLESKDGDS